IAETIGFGLVLNREPCDGLQFVHRFEPAAEGVVFGVSNAVADQFEESVKRVHAGGLLFPRVGVPAAPRETAGRSVSAAASIPWRSPGRGSCTDSCSRNQSRLASFAERCCTGSLLR